MPQQPPIHLPSPMRRRLMTASFAAAVLAAARATPAQDKPRINPPALLENIPGGYLVLPAGSVYCGGVVAAEGHEIVHALLRPWVPLDQAWDVVEAHLKTEGRPIQALCGLELRTPKQLTFEGFRNFNLGYMEELRKRELILRRYSAVCRTNVVPAHNPPDQPMVHAFSYSATSSQKGRTFCVSGAADIDSRGNIVAGDDVTPAGMKQRLQHCTETISDRLAELELSWNDATHVDLCVTRNVDEMLAALAAAGVPRTAARGIRVHDARPPIIGAEVELECRGVRRQIELGA